MLKCAIHKGCLLFVFSIVSVFFFSTQAQAQFTTRKTWDGPYDIKMIAAPNLQPVYVDPTKGSALLADSVIPYHTIQMTGDLLSINNRFKGGSPFNTVNIPRQAITCTNPDAGCGTIGLTPNTLNSTCPTERYNNPITVTKTIAMTYADYDTDLTTYSSSMAKLDISSCSEVESAFLYWTGYFKGSNPNITLLPGPLNTYSGVNTVFNTSTSSGYDQVKLKIPGGTYQNVTATAIKYVNSASYICGADVTSIVQGSGSGEFWVGNIQTYPHDGDGGSNSGWNLVVVFRSPLSPPRTITLYDGNVGVGGSNPASATITLTGLQAPSAGNFKSYVGFAAIDGENLGVELVKKGNAAPQGMDFQTRTAGGVNSPLTTLNPFIAPEFGYKLYTKKGYPGSCNNLDDNINEDCKIPLYDANWCTIYDDITSSRISTYDEVLDKNGMEIERLPSFQNTLGIDAHHLRLPQGSVIAGANQATLTVRAGPQGGVNFYMAYIAIERLQPKLEMTKFSDKNSTGLSTQITYTLRIKNAGNDASIGGDKIYDTLDAATNFVPGSLISKRYVNGVLTSPAPGATLVSSANDELQFNLANPIAPKDSVDIIFTVDVIPYASNPALYNPPNCKRTIENTAYVKYNTITSGILQSKSNANDCGIGSETRVLIVDPINLPPSTTYNVGSFDGCPLATTNIISDIKSRLITYNASLASSINDFDIRDASYVRVGASDVFGAIVGTITFNAIRDGGAACQETYVVEYVCNPCTPPVITSAATDNVCSGSVYNYTITADQVGTTFSWSRALVTNISNAVAANQTANPISETLVNTSASAVVVRYIITPTNAGCAGTPFNLDVTVNPKPVVNSSATGTVCSGVAQNYNITSNIASATFSWDRAVVTNISNAVATAQAADPIVEALTNTSAAAVVVRYVITPAAGGCPGNPFNYDVTVNPTPVVNSSATGNVCSGVAQNYNITSNVSTATFSWSRAVVANISNSIGSGTSDPITETLTNTSAADVVVRYVITPTAATCAGPAFNYDVTVNPKPAVTSASTDNICSATAQNYTITSNVAGATFSWSRAAVTNISNGTVSAQTTNPITESLTNTSASSVVVRYIITPSAAGCAGNAFNYDLTVRPTPAVNSQATGSVCSGLAQTYDITSNVSSATFSWSRAAVTDISNPAVAGASTDPITETLTNTSVAPVIVRYVITPSAGGCTGSAFNYDVTVNPVPVVTSAATDAICSNTSQNYTITSNVGAATFSWSRAVVAGISNPAAVTQSSNPITETLTNTGSTAIVVRYEIIPSVGGCTGATFDYDLTVNPTPYITSAATGNICSGTAQNYDISSNIGTATFVWSRAAVTNISNAAESGQASDPIVETLTNTGNSPVVVRYVITPTAAGTCPGTPFNYDVTVNPIPSVNSLAASSICSGVTSNYDITSNVSNATFSWSRAAVTDISNPAVAASSSDPIAESLENISSSPIVVRYVITPSANGCTGTPFNYDLTVNPSTVITTQPLSDNLCAGDPLSLSVSSTGLAPTYQWKLNGTDIPGATSSTYSVASSAPANAGDYTVVLTNACPATSNIAVIQVTTPPINTQTVVGSDICANGNATVTVSNSENNITYEAFIGAISVSSIVPGNGGNLVIAINNAGLVVGANTITINAYGCNNTVLVNQATINVTAIPLASAGPDIQVDDYVSILLDGSNSSQGASYVYQWTSSDPNSVITDPTFHTTTVEPRKLSTDFTLTVIDINNPSCPSSDVVNVKVAPKPVEIPNAFSPNGDGVHDMFEIKNMRFFSKAILYIYNQWGELIFKSDSGYLKSWDGKRNGAFVPVSAYYYILELNEEGFEPITGHITVIR